MKNCIDSLQKKIDELQQELDSLKDKKPEFVAVDGNNDVDDFEIGKYPVTVAEFKQFLDKYPNADKPLDWDNQLRHPNRPVVGITWYMANMYASSIGCRLPTEAEWEYAAKGGNKSKGYKYSGSDNPDDVGWYCINSDNHLHDVGEKEPNELGIYDMSGNVWEWCYDRY